MEFGLSAEQGLLQDTVIRFLTEQSSLDRVRRFADGGETRATDLVDGLAALGVYGLIVPESQGGVGLTLLDAAVVSEALGYAVAPTGFLSTAVVVPSALLAAGSQAQQDAWLPRLAAAEVQAGIALSEHSGVRRDAGVTCLDGALTGRALFVLDFEADVYLVADRSGGLHLIAADAAGLERRLLPTIDRTRPMGELILEAAPAEPLPGAGPAVVRRLLDIARVMLAADTLGAAQNMLDQAVAYAQQREQFNRVIASFQAVKHMCAEMAAEIEPLRAFSWYAGHALTADPEEAHLVACHFKALAQDVGKQVAKTATEVHGGMGFTDLVGLHYWFKRIGFNRQVLGSPELLRELAARAQGFAA